MPLQIFKINPFSNSNVIHYCLKFCGIWQVSHLSLQSYFSIFLKLRIVPLPNRIEHNIYVKLEANSKRGLFFPLPPLLKGLFIWSQKLF